MIRAENLVRKYGDTVAVDGISFDISPREAVGVLGPNGAGKTTTLRVLAGFLHPTSGRVGIGELDVLENPLECRRQIGYLPENNPLYEDMEVSEYLEWVARTRGLSSEACRSAIQNTVGRCGLAAVVGKSIGELSKGYRQRVGLAAAIIHDPPILLLDEPTSGLDPNQALEVRGLIAELKREKTVLLSSHILSEVRASCDRVIIIHRGKIAAQGRPEELAASASRGDRLNLVVRRGAGDLEEVRRALAGLPGVASLSMEAQDGEARFVIMGNPSAEDMRPMIYELAVAKKWPVLELYREAASLEEIFRSLTA
ncbi:MAG: ATP-binding cassette domain-containing protein [Elusimicrobia bacterium]|nr:ATP-binding cassette domain-containing protein [Elusimicrobiota bacterium]